MAAWIDITALLLPAYWRPVFGEAGAGFPGSTAVVVNPTGPNEPPSGAFVYATYATGGDRSYAFSAGAWRPSDSEPELYVYDSDPDPDFTAPGVLGLLLPAPLMAYGARLMYSLPTTDTSGSSNMVFSIPPLAMQGTIDSPPASMTPGAFDDPWSADDAATSWAVQSPFTNTADLPQVVERSPSDYLRPVAGFIASVGGFTGSRETFDRQKLHLNIISIELFMDEVTTFWTNFVNTREV